MQQQVPPNQLRLQKRKEPINSPPPLLSTKELRRLAIKTKLMRRGAYTFHSNAEIFCLLPAFIFSPRVVLHPSRHILEKGRLSVLGKADCVCLYWQQTTNAKCTSKGSLWSCWPLLRQYRIKQRGPNFFPWRPKLKVICGPWAKSKRWLYCIKKTQNAARIPSMAGHTGPFRSAPVQYTVSSRGLQCFSSQGPLSWQRGRLRTPYDIYY